MKKTFLYSSVVLLSLFVASCAKTRHVKEFVEKFASASQKNETNVLAKMYPSIVGVPGKIYIKYNPDSVTVNETEDGFLVDLGHDRNLIISGKEELIIKDSHGVISYDSMKIKLALSTGWIEKGMSDIDIASQFKDIAFIDYLKNKLHAQISSKLVTRIVPDYNMSNYPYACYNVDVVNRSSFDIPGNRYSVKCSFYGTQIEEFEGKDINAGETVNFIYNPLCLEGMPTAEIMLEELTEDNLLNMYVANGEEYSNYFNGSKNVQSKTTTPVESLILKISEEEITENDLVGLSRTELRLLRNSLYAKHGYIFKTKDMIDYFSKQDWYNEITSNMDEVFASFNIFEKNNLNIIQQFEAGYVQ